ncbi:hypothetical protein ABPG72_008428 [Tetrahymena utriculariae]
MTHISINNNPQMNSTPRKILIKKILNSPDQQKRERHIEEPSTPCGKKTRLDKEHLIYAPKKQIQTKVCDSYPTISRLIEFDD